MACTGRQKPTVIAPQVFSFGEVGLIKMEYLETTDAPFFGQATGQEYPFNEQSIMFVDRRDAVYMLSADFRLLE